MLTSPYLDKPIRTLEQAKADIEAARILRQRRPSAIPAPAPEPAPSYPTRPIGDE